MVHEHAQPLERRHQLVVAFQGGVQLGAVDDHGGLLVVAHLLEGEGTANHVAGETLPAFGVGGFAADAVVHREAGVTPLEYAFSESGLQHTFGTQEMQYLVSQRLTEHRNTRKVPEGRNTPSATRA
ncbi:MAG: hypothetical protein P8Y80_17065 [Acidobacteriota bacterium]